MGEAVGGVPRDEDVDVAGRLAATAVAAHDFDPELRIDGEGGLANGLKDLFTFRAGDARVEVVVELDSELGLESLTGCTF